MDIERTRKHSRVIRKQRSEGENEYMKIDIIKTNKKEKEEERRGEEKTRKVLFLLALSPRLVIPEGAVVVEQGSNMQIVAL